MKSFSEGISRKKFFFPYAGQPITFLELQSEDNQVVRLLTDGDQWPIMGK